jgi:SAM-dependent methyltransferase
MAAWALSWIAERGAPPKRVLDLACGTGEAALVFAAAGCRVAGVDQSAAMLEIARGKARDAGYDIPFVQADICRLAADDAGAEWRPAVGGRSSVDLVTCFYDSLNYLTADGDLDRVFAGVGQILQMGGSFVFDMNTTAEYVTWDERDAVTHDGPDCLVYNKLSYEPAARQATGRIVWFVRETERWWRGEETHVERGWSEAEVRSALAGAGLALAGRWDVEGHELVGSAEDTARVVYIARRQA